MNSLQLSVFLVLISPAFPLSLHESETANSNVDSQKSATILSDLSPFFENIAHCIRAIYNNLQIVKILQEATESTAEPNSVNREAAQTLPVEHEINSLITEPSEKEDIIEFSEDGVSASTILPLNPTTTVVDSSPETESQQELEYTTTVETTAIYEGSEQSSEDTSEIVGTKDDIISQAEQIGKAFGAYLNDECLRWILLANLVIPDGPHQKTLAMEVIKSFLHAAIREADPHVRLQPYE